jgi:hypothetical protein
MVRTNSKRKLSRRLWSLIDGSGAAGICPCLTPSMVPFITNRGGPLVGIEALSLQGIPVDDLLLTRESEVGGVITQRLQRRTEHDLHSGWMLTQTYMTRFGLARPSYAMIC